VRGAYYTTVLALHYFQRGGEGVQQQQQQQQQQTHERGTEGECQGEEQNQEQEKVKEEKQKPKQTKQLIFLGSLAAYAIPPTSLTALYTLSKFSVRGLFKSVRYASLPDTLLPATTTTTSAESTSMRSSAYTPQLPYALRANLIAPSWVATGMLGPTSSSTSISNAMQKAGLAVASIADVVNVAMRIACDSDIWGRAVGVVPGASRSGVGDAEGFDLKDDPAGGDGGRVIWDFVGQTEVFGKGAAEAVGWGAWC